MTQTHTTTQTWSRTHARYVAGKVAADLRQMQQAYGKPSDDQIEQFTQELVEYLTAGFLDYVEYGFQKNGEWVVALRYTAEEIGSMSADDRSGRVRRGVDITGASWASYLVKNGAWESISDGEKTRFRSALPFSRTYGDGYSPGASGWSREKAYSSAGGGVTRYGCGG